MSETYRYADRMKTSLRTKFLGVTFPNPLILPSGIIQEIPDHLRAIDQGIGGITLKSLTVEKREGNPLPRVWKYDQGYINSVGLRNPGLKEGIKQAKKFILESHVPVIISIYAVTVSDFQKLARAAALINPAFIELNLSSPNTYKELGESLGKKAETTLKAVAGVKKIVGNRVKIIAKLTPNVPNISDVAKAAEDAGADAISAINTVGPGMIIDINRKKPVLGNREGGVSGSGIKPVAIRCVYDIYRSVKIPIIGMGGISNWKDTIEMMMAGATLIGVGSAVYSNKSVYEDIKKGLVQYMKDQHISTLQSLVGGAH
jgi:dihydroorotate dehydrogenase (NAD+) catalytic subunit